MRVHDLVIHEPDAVRIDAVLAHKQELNALPTPLEGIARGRRIVFVHDDTGELYDSTH